MYITVSYPFTWSTSSSWQPRATKGRQSSLLCFLSHCSLWECLSASHSNIAPPIRHANPLLAMFLYQCCRIWGFVMRLCNSVCLACPLHMSATEHLIPCCSYHITFFTMQAIYPSSCQRCSKAWVVGSGLGSAACYETIPDIRRLLPAEWLR